MPPIQTYKKKSLPPHPKGLGGLFVFTSVFFLLSQVVAPPTAKAELSGGSLSDFSIDSLEKEKPEQESRDPFSTPKAGENLDPATLNLQGIIVGPDTRLCLIGGKVYKIGNLVGSFLLKEINPGKIHVQTEQAISKIGIDGYMPAAVSDLTSYNVSFQNADLKSVLKLFSVAGKFNVMIPEDTGGIVNLTFHNIALKDALGSILRVNELEFAEENGIVRVGEAKEFPGNSYLETKTFVLRYAAAKDMITAIKSMVSEKGLMSSDDRTNTLTIRDTPSVLNNMTSLIQQLDSQDEQVRIEAKIVDVSRDFGRSLGIQWGLTKPPGQRTSGFGLEEVGNSPNDNPFNVDVPIADPTSGIGILVGNLTQNIDLEARITAAENRGDAHIISQPSITTLNNTPASIRSGVTIYIKQLTSAGSGSAESGAMQIQTGIELGVTPQISEANTIKLLIKAVESEADFARTVDGIPSVRDNTASTTVLVANGETTVIGGLMKVSKSNVIRNVPFVSSVPVLGWLGKSKAKRKSDTELLIFITPYLVDEQVVSKQSLLPPPILHDVPDPSEKKVPSKRKLTRGLKYE